MYIYSLLNLAESALLIITIQFVYSELMNIWMINRGK